VQLKSKKNDAEKRKEKHEKRPTVADKGAKAEKNPRKKPKTNKVEEKIS